MRITSLPSVGFLSLAISLAACAQSEPRIDYGKVECAHCRMNVVDQHYAAALVTKKGRQYVFDDLACMVQYVADGAIAEDQVAKWYICDHANPGMLCDATQAHYLSGPAFRSPMRGDMAAFCDPAVSEKAVADGVRRLDWNAARTEILK